MFGIAGDGIEIMRSVRTSGSQKTGKKSYEKNIYNILKIDNMGNRYPSLRSKLLVPISKAILDPRAGAKKI